MKALAKMEELAPLRAAAEFSFEFREPLNAPNPLLVMEDVDAGYRSENEKTGEITERPSSRHQLLAADRPAYRPAGCERRR
jgi:ATP-binding cassette subfamily F protein 3